MEIILAILLILNGGIVFAGNVTYDMDLAVDPEKGLIEGTVKISIPREMAYKGKLFLGLLLNNGEAPNPKTFPFFERAGPEGFSASGAEVSALEVDGRPMAVLYTPVTLFFTNYNLDRMGVEIELAPDHGAEAVFVGFHYSARLAHKKEADDFFFKDAMFSRVSWFPYLKAGADLDRMTLPPFTYSARLILPREWDMARVGTSWSRAGEKIEAASSAPVASFPLAFMKGYKVYSVGWLKDTKAIDVYHRPDSEDSARLAGAYAKECLEYYSARYFPLEYSFVSIVQDNAPGTYGLAADSLVLVGDGAFGGLNRVLPGTLSRLLEYVLAHELGHFYWGMGTSADILSENYLCEGIDEYSTLEYIDGKYGRWDNLFPPSSDLLGGAIDSALASGRGHSWASRKVFEVIRNRAMGWDTPLSRPAMEKIANGQSALDYDKPCFVLGMLARYVGRDSFRLALAEYAMRFRHRESSTAELESFMEGRTGKNLTAFFDAFIYGTKSVDYELSGILNTPSPQGFHSGFIVRDMGDSGIFIPTTLTVFLEDGTSREIPVDAPGGFFFDGEKVRYAVVDKDAEALDYDRKNNFTPRGLVFASGADYWLLDGAADKIWAPNTFFFGEPGSGKLDFGFGVTASDDLAYSMSLAPVISIPEEPVMLDLYSYGVGFAASAKVTGSLTAAVNAAYIYPSTIAGIGVGLTQQLLSDLDVGLSGRYYYPVLTISLGGYLIGLNIASPAGGYISSNASLILDLLPKSGTTTVLENDMDWFYGAGAVEDRVSIDFVQAIPFLRRLLLGLEVKASGSFGSLVRFGGSNAALGIDSTGNGLFTYGASVLGFIGIPLLNDLETAVANVVVLQSLNLALVYEAGAAFNGPAEIPGKLQHAAGVELLPLMRTLADMPLGVALRVSFDLNRIAVAPRALESYTPAFSLDLSVLPNLFGRLIAY